MIRTVARSASLIRFPILGLLLLVAYFLTVGQENQRLQVNLFPSSPTASGSCLDFPNGGRVVVAVKTGASEAAEKIPAQMRTSLRCAKNVFLFSDLEQDLGEFHLHDALDTVPVSVVDNNPDFKFYREQYHLWRSNNDITSLKGTKSRDGELAAWTLDKYKNLHIVEKTWALAPDMDWYVFIDADTYLFYPNLLMWLSTMDPNKKSYFGSEVTIADVRFAHGGTGIIMSRAAVYELAVVHNGTAAEWDPKIHEHCCGDFVLAMGLKEYAIELQDIWPVVSGESPSSIPLGPGTPQYWCEPAMTMHHVSPAEMDALADFERSRLKVSEPITHVELFRNLPMTSIRLHRKNWDNLASDFGEFGLTGGLAVVASSFEECAQACEANADCIQYSHHNVTCHIGYSARLGHAKDADDQGPWVSGWNQTRLDAFMESRPLCDDIKYPKQNR